MMEVATSVRIQEMVCTVLACGMTWFVAVCFEVPVWSWPVMLATWLLAHCGGFMRRELSRDCLVHAYRNYQALLPSALASVTRLGLMMGCVLLLHRLGVPLYVLCLLQAVGFAAELLSHGMSAGLQTECLISLLAVPCFLLLAVGALVQAAVLLNVIGVAFSWPLLLLCQDICFVVHMFSSGKPWTFALALLQVGLCVACWLAFPALPINIWWMRLGNGLWSVFLLFVLVVPGDRQSVKSYFDLFSLRSYFKESAMCLVSGVVAVSKWCACGRGDHADVAFARPNEQARTPASDEDVAPLPHDTLRFAEPTADGAYRSG